MKVGDRVVVTNPNSFLCGELGTVVEVLFRRGYGIDLDYRAGQGIGPALFIEWELTKV